MTGKVVFFSSERGYGFIEPVEGGDHIFVHHREICATGYRTLDRGAQVEYDLGVSEKNGKPMAVKVRQIGQGNGGNQTQPR